MKIVPTKRTDYAIRALVYLAQHEGERVKAAAIGGAMEIPTGFLHQVLRELQRAAFVNAQVSRNGGYALNEPADRISILDVVEALEGPVRTGDCALRGGPCHWEDVCALHWAWSSARQALADRLAEVSVAVVAADDLALAAGTKPVPADSHRRKPAPQARRTNAPGVMPRVEQ